MAIFKRGKVYWFEFVQDGQRYRRSAKTSNNRIAEQRERAFRTKITNGEFGIENGDEKDPVPTLREFAQRLEEHLRSKCKRPATVSFYRAKLRRLMDYAPLADSCLDEIDSKLIDEYIVFAQQPKTYKHVGPRGKRTVRTHQISPGTVNRNLAALRRALYLARKWNIINGVPKFEMLPGERIRDFVLAPEIEEFYLAAAPQPLQDIALLLVDTGLRVGEALGLRWADVHLKTAPGSKFGYVHVRDGKSKFAKRDVPLTPRAIDMLVRRRRAAFSAWVFVNDGGDGPWLGTSLNHQHQRARKTLKLSAEFVLHSLRHTMLTRLGLSGADVFTIKQIAGHSSVTVSERYVHPTSESKERAFERMMAVQRGLRDTVVEDMQSNGFAVESPHKSHSSVPTTQSMWSDKSFQ